MTSLAPAYVPFAFNANRSADSVHKPARRLLLVDDEPRLLASLKALLDGHGYDLVTATCGKEALSQLATRSFDLILLDLRMPDMDGHGVMDFINEQGIDVTVIILSGDTLIDAAIGSLQRGAYAYLRKPYQAVELLNTVSNALRKCELVEQNKAFGMQLEQSERLYRFLVDSSPDIIFTLDEKGTFTYVNGRVSELLGHDRHALLGLHYSVILERGDYRRARNLLGERRANARPFRNEEFRFKSSHPEAGIRTFEVTLRAVSLTSAGLHLPDEATTAADHVVIHGIAKDITERKRVEDLISYQAHHDLLTDLPNRILFQKRLEAAIAVSKRSGTQLCVMFVDLDRFKIINDSLGHQQGDEVLRQVARRLKECLRNGDTLARIGGDEFILLVPDLRNREAAQAIAEKFLKCFATPFIVGTEHLYISASIGISLSPEMDMTAESIIRHADIAMYQTKASGKNGYRFYDESMLDAAYGKIRLEQDLRRALERGELEMYYQPQVDVGTHEIVSAEALMRWNHPELGLLSAGQFIPLAEEAGLMVQLSDWMIISVCRDVGALNRAQCRPIPIAINLSPSCLEREDFYGKLRAALHDNEVPPERIEVEITENICIRNPHHAIDQLNRLADIGVRVAIDDFGTGYSSLAYLQRFQIHTLKIDQSFVKEIRDQAGHFPVVLAVISIAQGLKLQVVAEGVETHSQAHYLQQAGCQTMQGYLYHFPLRRERLAELISPPLIPDEVAA